MTIIIDDTNYELNVADAIKSGALKKIRVEITDIKVGDVFKIENVNACILILSSYDGNVYMAGLKGLACYSNYLSGVEKSVMIAYLNQRGHVFVKNINDEIEERLAELCKD